MAVPISNVTRRIVFAPSGTGPYAFTFEILADTDIEVYKGDTLLTLTTDYTVTINANGTGSVTLVATAGTDNITIVGARAIQRLSDFVTGGDFFANTVNDELDSLTIFAQQNAEAVTRSIQAPVTDPTTIDMTLPVKADRAGKYLSFNTDGDPEVVNNVVDITTVAGIASDVTKVSGIAANVTTVAGISSNVTTVAGISGNVTTVAGISGNVTTVAGISADVTAVAGDATDIGTVAGLSTEIAALGPIAADITAVAGDATYIGIVAGNIDSVVTVGNNITNVNKVGVIDANVTTVAGIDANVTTVAGIAANVTTVAGVSANVTTVANNIASVNKAAGNIDEIIAVANDLNEAVSEIEVVANNIALIEAVGGNIDSIVAVGGNIDSVITVATNIADVNNFADVYIGASATAPSTRADGSALQVGDLYFNTSDDQMKVYDGSAWQSVGSTVNGTAERFKYVATSSQTTFSGTDANGNTLAYDPGFLDVFLNGVRLDETDFTATTGTSIVLDVGAATDDELNIVAYGNFELADVYTKAQSDAKYQLLDADTAKLDVAQTWSANQNFADYLVQRPTLQDYAIEGSAIGNVGATRTFDLAVANFFSATVDQASTFTFSNPPASGDFGAFVIELTNGGAFVVTWPAAVDWPGGTSPTLTASGVDQLIFTTRDAGTTWYGFVAGLDIKSP